ncbi:capsular biosynthesis protein [Alteraurantiacibacter aquimixticola]|uniref:Capsular biosynthesis protein n=1 Tax=Alteraurantiacibacter aquimixticola TaxID=2489173 RepID=A0A4T3F1Q5_9SPHN|nr:capsular biosynthesis protein [Alteraurantiacibacter aquimixticola]TIX49960.1 capsular biosynthesis protein [Alteraurantiacibacter aquimixticola]
MTEQSKIPVPGKGEGKSLFERAESMFGEKGYTPAPVPRDLARPVNRKVVKQKRSEPVAPAEAPVSAEPAATPQPAPLPEQPRIALPGNAHPVDRDALTQYGLINPDGPVTALLEEFRIVKRQLLKAARADASGLARRILVSSALPDEGKTFCAVNLALAMAAERDCEVILVDADVAKPSILSLLGLPKGPGLMDALANPDVAIEDCVIATDIAGLHVLPAGNQTHTDSEYLAAAHTGEVLSRLTQGAPERVLIFDSPPALAASPAADLAHHVGQALVVARADKTGQSALEDALTLLSNCPDLKLLLNDAHFSPSGRRFGAYYGYGD